MEGLSHEVCSLAGTFRLSKLVAIYDDNGISIDGHVEHWFNDDTPQRFEAYGWRVIRNVDGHDTEAIEAALAEGCTKGDRPTLICCKTVIGQGSPNKAGSHEVHGAALGKSEAAATRAALGWSAEPFQIPQDIRAAWDARGMGAKRQADWQRRFADYAQTYPELAREYERRVIKRQLPANWLAATTQAIARLEAGGATIATRKASQNAIDTLHGLLPELLGGSADLTGSNLTAAKASTPVRGERWGDYINYGVREFGMSAAMNGIALHGGYIPFGGTFLTFSDYSRNAIRMSALMQQCVIYVFTHDSIGLGEDGPTHQPVEQISSLRLIPNNDVWRPCDDLETLAAWLSAVERSDGPTCLILSRQSLPHCERTPLQVENIRKGGYVLAESDGAVVTLLATGSEVSLAMQARATLADLGLFARVVSMPSCREFDRQSLAYRSAVLPRNVPVLAIEAGVTNFWRTYVGLDGEVIGIDRFGESAPAEHVAQELGLTVNAVVDRAQVLALRGGSC